MVHPAFVRIFTRPKLMVPFLAVGIGLLLDLGGSKGK
jgi:hypothetical protein